MQHLQLQCNRAREIKVTMYPSLETDAMKEVIIYLYFFTINDNHVLMDINDLSMNFDK